MKLLVNGSTFGDWHSIDIDSDIFAGADAWQVSASSPPPSLVGAFREGQRVEVYIGPDRQLAGVVDVVRLHGDRQGEHLELSGRDLGAFLADSEAQHMSPRKYTLLSLVKKLLDPSWGIRNVVTSFDRDRKLVMGKKDRGSRAGTSRGRGSIFGDPARARSTIDPGQRVAQILDRRTSQLGITWWVTPGGDLFLGKPSYDQEPSYRFMCRSPQAAASARRENNIDRWEVVRQMSDRYSEILVAGQGAAASGTFLNPSSVKASKFTGRATDPDLVARGINRKMILVDSDCLTAADAQRRADSEMGHRRLEGLTIHLDVHGFRQGPRLYAIDTLAHVEIETAGISGTFYVTQRRFREGRQGRTTSLTLHQPKVWLA